MSIKYTPRLGADTVIEGYADPIPAAGLTFGYEVATLDSFSQDVLGEDSPLVKSFVEATTEGAPAAYDTFAEVAAAIDLKANTSDMTTALGLKADTSDMTIALGLKADASDMTTALGLKADTSDVTTALGLKADTSDVTTALGLKADASDLAAKLTASQATAVTGIGASVDFTIDTPVAVDVNSVFSDTEVEAALLGKADHAAVTGFIAQVEGRVDTLEGTVDAVIAALKAAGIMAI